jgi:DNA invertase Pin-like site-specific DNA recombinase
MARHRKTDAVAYLRTSSAAGVGSDKDSDKRQRQAIEAFARRGGFLITGEFYDAAVSGTEPLETRAGFSALLDRIDANGVRTVIVEDASRFARDLVTQELGVLALIKRGVTVLTASGDDLTASDDPFKKAMRQIAGAFAELEKARLVGKLKHARDRIRREQGRCEGRKPHAVVSPKAVLLAKRLRRPNRQTGTRLSLRQISTKLAEAGFVNERGQSYNPASIKSMIDGAKPMGI